MSKAQLIGVARRQLRRARAGAEARPCRAHPGLQQGLIRAGIGRFTSPSRICDLRVIPRPRTSLATDRRTAHACHPPPWLGNSRARGHARARLPQPPRLPGGRPAPPRCRCRRQLATAQRVSDLPDPTADLYPVKRNEQIRARPSGDRREDQHQLQQFLRVRLDQEHRAGGAGAEAAALAGQDRRHGREGAGDRHRRPDQEDDARGAPLPHALRRGLVDGGAVVGLPDGQAGGAREAAVVGEICAHGNLHGHRRSRRGSASAGIRGPTSKG